MFYLMHANNSKNELELVARFVEKHFAKCRMEKIINEMPKGQSFMIENENDQTKVSYDINIIDTFKIIEIPNGQFGVVHYDDETNNIEMFFEDSFCSLEDASSAMEEEINNTYYCPYFEEKDDDDNLIYGEYEDKEEYAHVYKIIGGKGL